MCGGCGRAQAYAHAHHGMPMKVREQHTVNKACWQVSLPFILERDINIS